VVLTRLGYQVTEAASGVAALKQWDEHAGAEDQRAHHAAAEPTVEP